MITRARIESAPAFTVFSGQASERRAGGRRVPYAVFSVSGPDGLVTRDAERLGVLFSRREPQRDDFSGASFDDIDAALAFLNDGGVLVKLPDELGSTRWRLYVVLDRFRCVPCGHVQRTSAPCCVCGREDMDVCDLDGCS